MISGRFKRLLWRLLVAAFLIFSIFFIRILYILPTLAEAKSFSSKLYSAEGVTKPPKEGLLGAEAQADGRNKSEGGIHKQSSDQIAEEKQLLTEYLISAPEQPDSFCRNLVNVPETSVEYGDLNQGNLFDKIIAGIKKNPQDSALIAIARPFRYIMSLKSIRNLVLDLNQTNEPSEQNSTLKFYSQLVTAWFELENHNQTITREIARSSYMYSLTQLIRQKPRMIDRPEVLILCESLMEGDLIQVKNDFKELLRFEGIEPEDIGYDPVQHSNFKISKSSENGIELQMEWPSYKLKALLKE